jgi:[ribosomal protein S5]-alanine N-acetyltransferase
MSQAASEISVPLLPLPITTRRLLIREYTAEDAAAVFGYVKDPIYWQYQRSEAPSEEQIKTLIEWVVREQAASPRLLYFMAAARRDSGEIIGEAVLKITNPVDRQGDLGFGVVPKFWKQGYGTEIGHAILDAAFEHFKLHRIAGLCSPDNKGSIRVMQKLGMAREGLLRDVHHGRGRWWSSVVYSLLEAEHAKIRNVRKG